MAREFSGELDPVPTAKEFTGALDPAIPTIDGAKRLRNPSFANQISDTIGKLFGTSSVMDGMDGVTPELATPEAVQAATQASNRAINSIKIDQAAPSERRRDFARNNPMLGALASGSARAVQSQMDAVPLVADAFNQYAVDPVLNLAGQQPMGQASRLPGAASLSQAAQDYAPEITKKSLKGAWNNDKMAEWLGANLAQQGPQVSQSLGAALIPASRIPLLLGMGAQASGGAYQQNKDEGFSGNAAIADALTKGNIEVLSEMLPLGVFDKVKIAVGGMSAPARSAVLGDVAKRLLAGGSAMTAQGLTGAIEELVAQFGGNVSDNIILGKNTPLMDKLPESAVLGAAAGKALALPHAYQAATAPNAERQIANAIDAAVANTEYSMPAEQVARASLAPNEAQMQNIIDPLPQPKLREFTGELDQVKEPANDLPTASAMPAAQPTAVQGNESVAPAANNESGIAIPDAAAPTIEQPATLTQESPSQQVPQALPDATMPAPQMAAEVERPFELPEQITERSTQLETASEGLRPGDIVAASGKPFATQAAAQQEQKLAGKGWQIKKGAGGFVIRHQPQTEGQVAAQRTRMRNANQVDTESDSMFAAIAKLGGIRMDDLTKQWGFDPSEFKSLRGAGIKRVGTANGMSLDRAGEALAELGYLSYDENGKHDLSELFDLFDGELRGSKHYTPQGYAKVGQAMNEQGWLDAQLAEQLDALPQDGQDNIEGYFDEYETVSESEEAAINTDASTSMGDENGEINNDASAEEGNNGSATQALEGAPPASAASQRAGDDGESARGIRSESVDPDADISLEGDALTEEQRADPDYVPFSRKTEARQNRDEYTQDMFGAKIPVADRENNNPIVKQSAGAAFDVDAADAVPDRGTYASKTKLVVEATRTLGASNAKTMQEVAQAMAYLGRGAVERFDALVTDKNGKPLAVVGAFKGGVSSTSVVPATLVSEAFRIKGAANIWFAHNHPSGKPDLSSADRTLNKALINLFQGSGIEAHGIFAITRNDDGTGLWNFTDGTTPDFAGATEPPVNTMQVNVVEREYSKTGKLSDAISSPQAAKTIAKDIANGESGILLLDVQNRPVGFFPVEVGAPLRTEGRMDAIYRAISMANGAGAMIVNNGNYDGADARNIAGLLNSLEVRTLDVFDIEGEGVESWAEKGIDFGSRTFFSKNGRQSGLSVDAVRAAIAADIFNHDVDVYATLDDAPEYVRIQARREGGGDVQGYWDMAKNKVALIASNLESPESAREVVRHELIGHYGLENMLNESADPGAMNALVKRVIRAEQDGNKLIQELGAQVDRSQPGIDDKRRAKEIIAIMAERNIQNSITRRVYDAIRSFLKKIGFTKADITDAKIAGLLRDAQNYLRQQGRQMEYGQPAGAFARDQMTPLESGTPLTREEVVAKQDADARTAKAESKTDKPKEKNVTADQVDMFNEQGSLFARAGDLKSEAFKRWFGDSKVVDATGKPLVVYHGTSADFDSFDRKNAGKNTGNDPGDVAFHFTDSSPNAGYYAGLSSADGGAILPVYLSLKNPFFTDEKVINQEDIESARSAGHDGIIASREKSSEYIVFNPAQIKSATGNNGNFDPADANINFSRKSQDDLPFNPRSAFEVSDPNMADDVIRAMQNNKIDLKKVQDAIRSQGGSITENADAYLNEELYIGRAMDQLDKLNDNRITPLLKAVADAKLTLDDVNQYLYARHVVLDKVNAHLASLNPTQQQITAELQAASTKLRNATATADRAAAQREIDKWTSATPFKGNEQDRNQLSGMSDADAEAILATAKGKQSDYDRIAQMSDRILSETRRRMVTSGLETAAVIHSWEQQYKYYVPLMRDQAEGRRGTGRGYTVRGKETQRRTGSTKEATNILANIAAQAGNTIMRSEKAKVGRSLLDLARNHPNDKFWTVDSAPKKRTINKDSGLVEMAQDARFKEADNVLVIKENGEEHYLVFNKNNPRGMQIAAAFKNLDAAKLPWAIESTGKLTRHLAQWITARNPLFWITNFARDIQGAAFNLQNTPLAGKELQVMKNIAPAMRGYWKISRGDGDGKWADYAREFKSAGAETGYIKVFDSPADHMADLEKQLAQMQQGAADPRKLARSMIEAIDDYNNIIENGVRLAVYQAARENGQTIRASASIAKNITVNFNRRGNQSTGWNALYMFMNASIQGNARFLSAVATNRRAQVVAGALVGMGFVLDAVNRAIGGDDDETGRKKYDEIPEFEKEKNWIFMSPSGKYIKVPMPYGPHIALNLGRMMSEMIFGRDKSAVERALGLARITVDAFNPLGSNGSFGQLVVPSVGKPIMQVSENKTFTGSPLYRAADDRGYVGPAYTRHFRSTPAHWNEASKLLSDVTGGDSVKPGELNIPPEVLRTLFLSYAAPGLMQTADKTIDTATRSATGKRVEPSQIPAMSRFYGEAPEERAQERAFYEEQRKVKQSLEQIKKYAKDGNRDAVERTLTELGDGDLKKGRQIRAKWEASEKALLQLNAQRRRMETDKIDDAKQKAQLDRNEKLRIDLMRRALR